ncbi:sugar-binding domain-containing protein [Trueperella sp.]|uniref:sugar-binding transcriptional regulator n=1 Tax=Trueperella sp. TaxID=2699835 RepID=UPI0025D5BB55|nr:sugar-binding domain-containing protein [Trueperella sp.]
MYTEGRKKENALVSQHDLLVRVSKMYYELNMTQSHIAQDLGLSRVKVTRMLARARELGIVTISIRGNARPYEDLEAALIAAYGLKAARVVPAIGPGESARENVAREAAAQLAAHLSEGMTVAIGASRTVAKIPDFADEGIGRGVTFVPASGGYAGADRSLNPDHVAQLLADRTRGRSFALAAPLVGFDEEVASRIASNDAVDSVLSRARGAQVFLAGIGTRINGAAWGHAALAPEIDETELGDLVRRGALSDVSGRFFDRAGQAVDGAFNRRVIALTLEEIRKIPHRIVATEGADRSEPLISAVGAGLFNVVVIDRDNAVALLEAR